MFDKLAYGADDDGNEMRYKFVVGPELQAGRILRGGARLGRRQSHGTEGGRPVSARRTASAPSGDKHDEFEVVGVLAPTGTANDRAMFVNIEGFYLLEGHALAPKDATAGAARRRGAERAGARQRRRQPRRRCPKRSAKSRRSSCAASRQHDGADADRDGRQQGRRPHRPSRRAGERRRAPASELPRPDAAASCWCSRC